MVLYDVCIDKMYPHVHKPLSQTHSRYFLEVLNEYDMELQDELFYGAISHRGSLLMAGIEYECERIVDPSRPIAADVFETLINPEENQIQGIRDVMKLANKEESNIAFIPVLLDQCKVMFVISKDKEAFMKKMGLHDLAEFYDKYPVLCAMLKWGITYMLSDDISDRYNDILQTDISQSENYIRIFNEIVDDVMRYKWLPYASTIHAIARWNYEKQANYGYIDFIEPMCNSKKVEVKFTKPMVFSAREARTIRKYVELSSENLRIKAESTKGFIIGEIIPEDDYWTFVGLGQKEDNTTTVRFEGKASWRLMLENEYILYDGFSYSLKRIKEEVPDYALITEAFYRGKEYVASSYDEEAVKTICDIVKLARLQEHGTMAIFSPKAKEEATRLCDCGRGILIDSIDFKKMISENYYKAKETLFNLTKIDGAVFFDEKGVCYAIGIIVDGRACKFSNAGRGARYNSGLTYVNDCNEREISCYCAVVSEDGTVDIFANYGKSLEKKIKNEYMKSAKKSTT